MAWGNKEEKQPETPVEKKPDFNVEEFFTKLDATLSPIKTAVEETRSRISAIEESSKKKPEPATPQTVPSVLDDEDAAFANRLGPLAINQVKLSAKIIENEIYDEMRANGWDEY